LRERKVIETCFGEFDPEVSGIVDTIAARDDFVGKKAHADSVIVAGSFTNGAIDFQRQPHTIFARPTITVTAVISRAEEARHRVSVRVMQLNTIESSVACAPCCIPENS